MGIAGLTTVSKGAKLGWHAHAIESSQADLDRIDPTRPVGRGFDFLFVPEGHHSILETLVLSKSAKRVKTLGTGLGAGVRRNIQVMKGRLTPFAARVGRFRRLGKAGVNTARLFRTGM